ncbi:DUF2079 domain-containing protein [Planosporangium thailandense]|uniref:DUF2079 domain-containing protein n=1 Tax=Planosporangium thailandense TaxID=765197 RepID=A0ABX0XWV5_9ACTN|nr:DUF2079 domain-containing protein [Planosporangium thailandense]NJC70529.1 DUF2079 domain-containing protein [Planosporangium thailandense]
MDSLTESSTTTPEPAPVRPGVAARWRAATTVPYLLAAALFAGYTSFALRKHELIRSTGYDLGIFEQAVRGYAHGHAPVAELKGPGFNLLGDHFHPILMLLAPLYRLVPGPQTLLVAQAALFAVAAIPITRAAVRVLGVAGGACVGLAYGLSWGVQEAVTFDFHEICFAVPLLAFCLENLLRRRWVAAVGWALPLVAVKEDLPLTVAAIGGYLLLRGQRRLGAWTVAFGLASAVLIVGVVLPALNPAHRYAYWQAFDAGDAVPGARSVQAGTVLALLAVGLFVAARSPLILLAVPTLAWRFLSDNPSYWGTLYHYNAVPMVIVFAAFVDAVGGRRALDRIGVPDRVAARLRGAAAVGCLVVAFAYVPSRPLWELTDPAFWRPDPRVVAARALLSRIPDGAPVAATNRLSAQLTARCRVRLFPPAGTPVTASWVMADTAVTDWPYAATAVAAEVATLRAAGYRTVAESDGFVLLHR